jgi:nucleoside-diphosphate-sugar epimerase
MSQEVSVITGASGLLGSHVAEQLCARGARVRALVRPLSDTRFLETLPVEIVTANLNELPRNARPLEGASAVYHCAAFVRDWGTWHEFYDGTVEITRNVLDGCRRAGAGRFVHVSSISVYGNPPESTGTINEDTPTGQYLWPGDFYGRSKLLAEEAVRGYSDYVILRPSWIYGRRDLVSLPRVIQALRDRRARVIGRGDNLLNLVSAVDVARGVILAGQTPEARGQAYHLCSRGEISQREFFDLVSSQLELPRAGRRVPFGLAWRAASILEAVFRATRRRRAPPFTRRALLMLSRPTRFSIDKAERELAWRPEVPVREGLKDALEWNAVFEARHVPEPLSGRAKTIGAGHAD